MGWLLDDPYWADDGSPYWGQPTGPDPSPPPQTSPQIAVDTTVPVTRPPAGKPMDPSKGAGWRRDPETGASYYYDPAAPTGKQETKAADVRSTYLPADGRKTTDSFAKRNALNDAIYQQQAVQRPLGGAATSTPGQPPAATRRVPAGGMQLQQRRNISVGAPGYGPRIGQSLPTAGGGTPGVGAAGGGAYNPQQQSQGYAPATAPHSAASAAFGRQYAQRTNRDLQRMGLDNATNQNANRR